jgi:hypothetical protein
VNFPLERLAELAPDLRRPVRREPIRQGPPSPGCVPGRPRADAVRAGPGTGRAQDRDDAAGCRARPRADLGTLTIRLITDSLDSLPTPDLLSFPGGSWKVERALAATSASDLVCELTAVLADAIAAAEERTKGLTTCRGGGV